MPKANHSIDEVAHQINAVGEDIFLCCSFGVGNPPKFGEMVFYLDSNNIAVVGIVQDIEKNGIIRVDASGHSPRRFSAKNRVWYRTTRRINGSHSSLFSVEKSLDAIDHFRKKQKS